MMPTLGPGEKACSWVKGGRHLGVLAPLGTVARDLLQAASWAKPIRTELVAECQMPDEVRVPGSSRVVSRPVAWK